MERMRCRSRRLRCTLPNKADQSQTVIAMSSTKKVSLALRNAGMRPRFPISEFRRSIYANRVGVEKTQEGAAVISFALQTKTGALLDFERIVISPEGLERHKESVIGFLDRLGLSGPTVPAPPMIPSVASLGVADEFMLSTGVVSEVIFNGFSFGAASANAAEEITLQGVLRVQADKDALRQLIQLLYDLPTQQ
jgi:hypothetical protein